MNLIKILTQVIDIKGMGSLKPAKKAPVPIPEPELEEEVPAVNNDV